MGMLHLKFVIDLTIQPLRKIRKMKTLLGLSILSAFSFSAVFGGKCEPLFSQSSPSNWGDVRQGTLRFPIPDATTKWRVDITFDKPVHTLNPWDGANGKCTTSKNKCTFTNASWNSHKNAGNLKLGFETRFDHTTSPPKFKRIVFKYCTVSPCKKYDEKYIVECGEFEHLLDAIKWGTDYFIKCHVSDNEYYAQVGNGVEDHKTWSRPEDMTGPRPSYKIDCNRPGSDVAAETAASFASAAILFKGEDDAYSAKLLDHAKRMYKFADECRGKYSDSIHDASIFYKSWNGYNDELVWGAAWLYKATGDVAYFNKAKQYYDDFGLEGKKGVFSWDDKTVGVHALMAEFTGEKKYTDSLKDYCDHAVSGQTRSPGGMLHYSSWGSLRYAANTAFICLQAADLVDGKSITYTDLAQGQMDYILGD